MVVIENQSGSSVEITLNYSTERDSNNSSEIIGPYESKTFNMNKGKTYYLQVVGGWSGYIPDGTIVIKSKMDVTFSGGSLPQSKKKYSYVLACVLLLILIASLIIAKMMGKI